MDRFLDKTNGPMMTFFDVIYKLLILNVLFILFSLLGLVVFGVFPSWLTLHQLAKREFHDHEKGIKYFAEYKKLFFENIAPGNLLFIFVIIIGGITVLDAVFIFERYLGVDELTFGGIVFAIGGLLLSYIVFGMIAIFGVIWGYYDRFTVKDTIKFSFFTVLSSPIFILLSLLVFGLGYLVFSILVSAAPFVAISVPISVIILLYAKQYRKIFLIKQTKEFSYFNIRYIQDMSRYIDVINGILPEETMYIESDKLTSIIKQDSIDLESSVVVLDHAKEVAGFMIVSRMEDIGTIECLVVKKQLQQKGIASSMLTHVLEEEKYQKLICHVNKSTLHPSLDKLFTLQLFLKNKGFKEVEKQRFELDL